MDSNLAQKISANSPERLWFVARGNVLKGPYTTTQLREKVQKRELNFLDFCWRQGFNEWRPMGSVEDFDRRTKFRKLPQYPQVEVPASSTGGIYLKDTSPPEEESPEPRTFLRGLPAKKKESSTPAPSAKGGSPKAQEVPKSASKFEVSFARHKRHSISIYEWGLAVMFAVGLAYFAADYAMTEVSKSVLRHLATATAGTLQHTGMVSQGASQPQVWQPVFSAPGIDQMMPLDASFKIGLDDPFRLPVRFEGQVREEFTGLSRLPASAGSVDGTPEVKVPTTYVGEYSVHLNMVGEGHWKSQSQNLDPIFVRPVQVDGYLNLKNPTQVLVPQEGEPFLPTFAK